MLLFQVKYYSRKPENAFYGKIIGVDILRNILQKP